VPAGTTGDVRQEGVSNWVPLPNFYASRALSDKAYVGMGFYAPYGLGIGWENPEEFVGRTVIQEQSLRTFFITPLAIALQLSDWLAVGVKVSLVPASVHLKKTLGAGDNGQVLFPASRYGSEGTAELAGSAFGVGFGLGAQAEPYKNVKLGLSYRSAVTLDFAGQVDFNLPKSVPTEIQAKFPDGDIRGLITLPHSFAMGLAWETNKLSIEAAANLTLWQSYDELKIEFVSGLPSESTISPRDWEAAMTYRLGAEYQVLEMLSLRAGVIYDETPVPDSTLDPTLPDADRMIGTVGAGMKFGPMSADLAYMAVMLEERSVESSVTFPTKATYPARTINLLALSLGYTF
jgi:long-chain fatty acid transport protein